MKKLILILLILSSSAQVNSQAINESEYGKEYAFPLKVRFEKIDDGLGSTNYISSCIAQDKKGFIWFESSLGYTKYDGNSISCKKKDNCVRVRTIYNDKDSNMWAGGNGVLIDSSNVYNIDNFSDMATFINSISEYKDEYLIIATTDGLRLFNRVNKNFERLIDTVKEKYRIIDTCECNSIVFDEFKNLWIGTNAKGVFVLDSNNVIIKNYVHDSLNLTSLSHNNVRELFIDSKKNIWVGTENGLNFLKKGIDDFKVYTNIENNPFSISNNYIMAICEDKNNNIWIGTRHGGLNKLEPDGTFTRFKPDKSDPNSISHIFIKDLLVDYSNVLWICTNGGGVCKLDLQEKRFYTLSNTFLTEYNNNQNAVNFLYEDSADYLWVGIKYSNGIYKFKREKGGHLKFIEHLFISNNIKRGVLGDPVLDNESNLWFKENFGKLIEFNNKTKEFRIYEHYPEYMIASLINYDGNLLIGTEKNGLLKFNLEKREYESLNNKVLEKFSDIGIQTLFLDKKKNLWIGSLGKGLYKYEIEKDTLIHYYRIENDTNSIFAIIVTSIVEDLNGGIWAGSGSGFSKYDKAKDNFINYTSNKTSVPGFLEDNKGKLWLCARTLGLCEFDPVTRTARHYTINNGSQNFDIIRSCVKDNEGFLYFGGLDGLTYFHPDEIKDNPYIPKIALTDFQIFNESVIPSPKSPYLKRPLARAGEINLSYKENVFSFEFAALIYNNPSKNQYAYMMEGFDKDWLYCGTKRNATYTNLDPGDYTFRVKGSNNDGLWNEEGTSIKITISPPWWETWWFKSCSAAVIFLTAGFGVRKRFNKLKSEKQAQEEFSRKLLKSQEDERKRLASELHDSLAHDVLIMKNNAMLGLRSCNEHDKDKILNEISELSSSTLNDVRSITNALHPHQIKKLGLTKAIKTIVDRASKSTEINFILESEIIDKIFPEDNEVYLYRIVQEAINNIIKHSSASEALFRISRTDEDVSILISDNGKGFSMSRYESSKERQGLGLAGISERVKLLGGSFEVETEEGKGTTLQIKILNLKRKNYI